MLIKGSNIDFINPDEPNFFRSGHYNIVHPNLDDIERYILRLVAQAGRSRLVKYVFEAGSKGAYTYQYFNLDKLEIDNFDEAQGTTLRDPMVRASLDMMRARIDSLLQHTGA